MRTARILVLMLSAVAVLSGCSAAIKVTRLLPVVEAPAPAPCSPPPCPPPPSPPPPPVVEGIPFRVPGVYTIRVYQRDGDGYKEVPGGSFVRTLADPEELYALNFEAKALSDLKFDLKFRADGTLEFADLKETKKVDDAITDIGTQAVALYAAVGKRELDEAAAQKAALDAQKALLEAQAALDTAARKPGVDHDAALVAALDALNAANAAERELLKLPPGAPDADRAPLEDALRLARLKANQAFRKAGLEEPFPDAFP